MDIAVLVSGGVDSSVALYSLVQQGYTPRAYYLKIWLEDELSYLGSCPWQEDLSYVQAVCQKLGVPLEIISLQQEYHDFVVAYTVNEIKRGRTPNPDIMCNQQVKFGFFLDHLATDTIKVATGHYAQVFFNDSKAELRCAPDPIKDQTYFLSYLSQQQLQRALFPIGHLQKAEVRQLAHEYDLPTKTRKDSQGICFLGKLKFNDFIAYYLGEKPGPLREYETGKELGMHKGFWFHTIGQRQGMGLSGGPWYVVDKDAASNVVYVSRDYYSDEKERTTFFLNEGNWIAGHRPEKERLEVKLRHGKHRVGCSVIEQEQGLTVVLDANDQGIAPGQFAVFYDGDVCLGGGPITGAKR